VTGREPGQAPAGVRPAHASTDTGATHLRWVEPGSFTLSLGDRVAVLEAGAEWLGEVVVPPERLVEWPELERLPVVTRRVLDAEWPSAPAGDGRRLLESLPLPPELLARARPGSGPTSAGPGGGAGEAAEHH
jgi:hypothetical protein